MKAINLIVGAIVFSIAACSENNNRIEDTNTEANQTTLDETVTSGGRTEEEPVAGGTDESATSEINMEEGLTEVTLPQFENTDIRYYTAEGYRVYSIGKSSLFATGSASLRNSAEQSLEKISSTLAQREKEGQIMIYGFIDASENPNFKTDVGERRLQAIKEWLQNQGNIDASRISVQPIVDVGSTSSDAIDKEKESRIEIVVRDADE